MPPRRKLEYILDPKELQNFAVQIARGMTHLEQKQITHRYHMRFCKKYKCKNVFWKCNTKLLIQITEQIASWLPN
jgi:hypothetical protein